jgi:hypothetical protein
MTSFKNICIAQTRHTYINQYIYHDALFRGCCVAGSGQSEGDRMSEVRQVLRNSLGNEKQEVTLSIGLGEFLTFWRFLIITYRNYLPVFVGLHTYVLFSPKVVF